MYRAIHPSASLLPVLLAGLLCHSAHSAPTEPTELEKARTSWIQSLHNGELEARANYAAKLKKLQRHHRKSKKGQKLGKVEREIRSFENLASGSRSIPSAQGDAPLAGIKFARTLFRKDMTDMIEAKNKVYRNNLKRLQSRYSRLDRNKHLGLVKKEIVKLDSGKAIIEAGYGGHSGTSSQLENLLIGTTWNVENHLGKTNTFKFRKNGVVSLSNYSVIWKVKGPRHATLQHRKGHWTYDMYFSDDLESFEALKIKDRNVFWTGQKN